MLENASSENSRESSISVATHYAEVIFVKKRHRIGNLKCKRNYQSGNLLRHSLVSSMFYQNGQFCPRFSAFWAVWPTKPVKGRKSEPLAGLLAPGSEKGHPCSTTQETWVAICVPLIRPGGVAQP